VVRIFDFLCLQKIIRIAVFKKYLDDETDKTPGKEALLPAVSAWCRTTVEKLMEEAKKSQKAAK